MVILIPARAGSRRIPGKALKPLGGKPLIDWTVESALALGVRVVVCSEDDEILDAGRRCGAEPWARPLSTATDDAPDLTWLSLALVRFPTDEAFMVRRPTSPFVSVYTLSRAWADFQAVPAATAMRAMRPVSEHPMKMWVRDGVWMSRAVTGADDWRLGVEHHSCPTQLLPRVYVQTAGLELIRRRTLLEGSLTGDRLLPLLLTGAEALDLNTPNDWAHAEAYVDGLTHD